jgi:syntaxin 1B/2/3
MIPLGQSAHKLSLSDVSVRQQQLQNIKTRFKDAIQRYAEVEKDNRSKNRAKMERQVRIVYPQLSYEELQQIVRQAEMEGGSALFAQAVSLSFTL